MTIYNKILKNYTTNLLFILLLTLVIPNSCLIAKNLKVLFIGNSHTYVNSLPELISKLALSNNDTLIYDSSTPGGFTLQNHSTYQETIDKIYSNDWDFVVLQEQSRRPSMRPEQVQEMIYPYVEILNDKIKDNNICTETVFYMTWGWKNGNSTDCPTYPEVCSYEGMFERVKETYIGLGNEFSATIAPVGEAFNNSIITDTDSLYNLYASDNYHPSLKGSYLGALVFYATLFQKTPIGLEFNPLSTLEEKERFQEIAHNTVLINPEIWNINANNPVADFEYIFNNPQNNLSVQFYDNSTNNEYYLWDFGDDIYSTEQNPMHIYEIDGDYEVTEIVSSLCTSDTIVKIISTTTTFIDESNETPNANDFLNSDLENNSLVIDYKIDIFPNPTNGKFSIKYDELDKKNHDSKNSTKKEYSIKIIDISGKEIKSFRVKNISLPYEKSFNMGDLPRGVYFLQIKNIETINFITKKIIFQ